MAQFNYECRYVKCSESGELYKCDRPARGMFCEQHARLFAEVEAMDIEIDEYFKETQ